MAISTVNIEEGMPTVRQAKAMMEEGFSRARAQYIQAVKVIHGYGSSGKGGSIKTDIRKTLSDYKKAGRIKDYCPGENFEPFHEDGRRVAQAMPELRRDIDYTRRNAGITIVILR